MKTNIKFMSLQKAKLKYETELKKLTFSKRSSMKGMLKACDDNEVKENKRFRKSTAVLMLHGNVIVGWAILYHLPSKWYNRSMFWKHETRRVYVCNLFIDRKHRKQGLGTTLLKTCQEFVSKEKKRGFVVSPDTALNFFDKRLTKNQQFRSTRRKYA